MHPSCRSAASTRWACSRRPWRPKATIRGLAALPRSRGARCAAARRAAGRSRPRSLACAGSHQAGRCARGGRRASGGDRLAGSGFERSGGASRARIEASPDLQLEVANAEMMLALLLADQNGMTEAVAHGNRASTIAGDLSRRNPDDWRYRLLQVAARNAEAELLLKRGKRDAALEIYAEVEGRLIEAAGANPTCRRSVPCFATVQASMASLYDRWARPARPRRRASAPPRPPRRWWQAMRRTSMRVASAPTNSPRRRKRSPAAAAMESAALFRESRKRSSRCWRARRTTRRCDCRCNSRSPAQTCARRQDSIPRRKSRRAVARVAGKAVRRRADDSKVAGIYARVASLGGRAGAKGEFEDRLSLRERQLALEERLGSDGRDNRALLADATRRSDCCSGALDGGPRRCDITNNTSRCLPTWRSRRTPTRRCG